MNPKDEKITREQVSHVADLARLEMDDQSIATFSDQIDNILQYIDMLKGVDTQNTEATSHAISLSNAFRKDGVHEHMAREHGLSNAPEKENGHFIVPKVIG